MFITFLLSSGWFWPNLVENRRRYKLLLCRKCRRIIVTLCDVKCQANGGKAMENVRRYRLSQSLYCKSVGVVATSLAQSQFLWKSAHCSPHLIIYTCGICTCMHVHAHAQMDLRSLKFKIIPLMIQDLLAVCLEHCCAMLFSPF